MVLACVCDLYEVARDELDLVNVFWVFKAV